MASGGARPNSESSSFLFEPLACYSEASSWLGCVRCLRPQSYLCPIPNSTYRQAVLAGCRCFTPSAGCFMPNVPLADRCRFYATWPLHTPRGAEQPPHCRCRCAAPDRHLQLSRLPPRLTTQGLNPLGLGVHPALQFAYPAFGTGAYPALWNPRKQSQKTCNRTSARDLEASPARSGASAAERCPKTDVLSVVRKSRNSSGGLYRRCRPSAHDRPQPNAMRFLMKTLRARPTSRLLPAFRQNFLWIRSGCPTVFLSPAKPGSGYQGTDSRVTITTPGLLAPVQSRCCCANTPLESPFAAIDS